MAGDTPEPPGRSREDRLKAALKANMAKRKAQTRARALAAQGKEGPRKAPTTKEGSKDG
jgi:hypothetical protein